MLLERLSEGVESRSRDMKKAYIRESVTITERDAPLRNEARGQTGAGAGGRTRVHAPAIKSQPAAAAATGTGTSGVRLWTAPFPKSNANYDLTPNAINARPQR